MKRQVNSEINSLVFKNKARMTVLLETEYSTKDQGFAKSYLCKQVLLHLNASVTKCTDNMKINYT